KPAIVDFQLLNQTSAFQGIWAKDQLTLRHDQNSFRLSFTALHYAAPAHNQLRYRLEGLHETWVDPGNEHSANFIGLPPGKYIFHLKAANHDGLWSEAINFQLTILPPWWRSWWAYLFYILLLALAIYTLYTYALRQWKLKAQLELEQQEADRLKELDRVKNRLFTNISHEFRTPLTVIMGMADQLASFSMASTKTHWQHGLLMIKRNGQNLLRLVNQMLNLSRLEAGHLPLKLVQEDIIAFVKYVLESFYSLAETKNIQLSFHAEETTFFMDFDLEKLQDILSNLVTNALKFTPEGGEIQISAKVLEQTDPHLLQLAVSDTGSGIAADQLPLIFDRFYQGTDSATRSSGTGIGLALTIELVKLMEGTISVQSQVEVSSTFTLRLPIHRTAAMNTWASIDNPADISLTGSEDLNKPLLLIVEDNQDVVLYLRTLLSDHYHLQIAPNGKVGVETAIEYTPDLIVCDVMMPELD
ncbi:MAG: hypothetical protein KDC44_13265, partial [Phaeodactylibacter sp.]|nr:hypothetical protein [Phaeodactylibacter sp.]